MNLARSLAPLLVFLALGLTEAAQGAGVSQDEPKLTEPASDQIERDFPMRRVVALHLSNLRGGITVQGWSQDRIRVRAIRKITAESEEAVARHRAATDIRFAAVEGVYEVSADYGKGLTLEERLKERRSPKAQMELQIWVPQSLSLRIGTLAGDIKLSGWKGTAEVRSSTGDIEFEDLEDGAISVFCDDCALSVKRARAKIRASTRAGLISLADLQAPSVFIETQAGKIRAEKIRSAQQLYVSHAGDLQGKELTGHIEFSNTTGAVTLESVTGFVSGRTLTGAIRVDVSSWRFAERALFESQEGSILLRLPRDFVGEVDLRSMAGKVKSDFALEPLQADREYGPSAPNHLHGRIGQGSQQLRAESRAGNVELSRGL